MKTKSLVLGTFALCIGMGLFTACDNTNNNKPETPTTPEKLVMTAPQVAANESGFIFLEDFPETDPHLTVKVSEDFTTATISYDGKEIQTVTSDELASDTALVRFLDANFDGLTDIYIGPGVPRTANSLLVWNENEQKFISIEGTSLQNAMLEPETKSFIEGGSNSAVEYYISRSLFNGDKMEMQEQLSVIMAPEEYANNNVEHKYTLSDPEGKVLCSTETADGLPEIWQKIVTVFDY